MNYNSYKEEQYPTTNQPQFNNHQYYEDTNNTTPASHQAPPYSNARSAPFAPEQPPFADEGYRSYPQTTQQPASAGEYPADPSRYPQRGSHYRSDSGNFIPNPSQQPSQREYSEYPQQAYPASSSTYEAGPSYPTQQQPVYPAVAPASDVYPSSNQYPPSANAYPAYPQQQPPRALPQSYTSPARPPVPFGVAGYYPSEEDYQRPQPSLKIKLPAMANDVGPRTRGSNTITIPQNLQPTPGGRVTRGSTRAPPPPPPASTITIPTHGRNTRSADVDLVAARSAAATATTSSGRPLRATRSTRGSTANLTASPSPSNRRKSAHNGGGKARSRGKGKGKMNSDFDSEDEDEDEAEDSDLDSPPPPPSNRPSRGRKSNISYREAPSEDAFDVPEDEEEEPEHFPVLDAEPVEADADGEIDADGDAEMDEILPKPEIAEDMFKDDAEVISHTNGVEKGESEVGEDDEDGLEPLESKSAGGRLRGRRAVVGSEDEEGGEAISAGRRQQPARKAARKTVQSDWEDDEDDFEDYNSRRPVRRNPHNKRATRSQARTSERQSSRRDQHSTRQSGRRTTRGKDEEDNYVDDASSGSNSVISRGGSFNTSSDVDADGTDHRDDDIMVDSHGSEDEVMSDGGRPYSLRQRKKTINYAIPPPLEDIRPVKKKPGFGGGRFGGNARAGPSKGKGLGWNASGADLDQWMGVNPNPADSSDSDYARAPAGKPIELGGPALPGGTGMAAGMPSGGPADFGRVAKAALADADPLGVNTNVTFDEVGGLDGHIHQLKEMTLLPLLYPEVFQQFNVTPPRGVLFHGPPGTGKTLLARALAASCRTDGKEITFFMRKGADCLSKWVGEAERQLRLLFDEAKACQPSIIFFDEIDGLAPVRSSKQDQIHASIVSTLLALMDGMDGRGQVVVIGATNRPDAVDPALRRPGRFDREFYFPLPDLPAREKILGIMTKGWDGWGQGDDAKENIKGLAKLTKGYGGADLRALCTEAALNAVQRRYPQIYQSNERLLLKPETIGVGLRDFMISVKKLVPSSARSSSSAAAPLPPQFTALLTEPLERVKEVISKVLPVDKKRTALEEAQFEEDSEEGALKREMAMQSMETLRVYRPRMVLHGRLGMGQGYVGAAALHHLEGYHVQSLELGTLMSDSTRSIEAAIVQLFVEAKRHQPSVIYIPSLVGWCAAVTETSRSTVRAMLETLAPTDPILLLAIVDGRFADLPRDVRAWFGSSRENRVELLLPTLFEREQFFAPLLEDVQKPPNEFADGVKRRKRVLEVLPVAPPLEPRQPTEAELALQDDNDQRTVTLLKYRLEPILTTLKRKFKKFTKRATEEYDFNEDEPAPVVAAPIVPVVVVAQVQAILPDGTIEIMDDEPMINGEAPPIVPEQQEPAAPLLPLIAPIARPRLFDMDLEQIHTAIFKGKYLTPNEFLDDVGKIMHNARVRADEDQERMWKAHAMFTAAQVSIQELDPTLKADCDRMAPRERKRRDDYRKTKKGKARELEEAAAAAALPPVPRRSGRTSGQDPEVPVVDDPSQLERKLKRQRSDLTGESPASDGGEGTDRSSKRAKIGEDDAHVRFADGVEVPAQPEAGPSGLTHEAKEPTPGPSSDALAQDSMLVDAPPTRPTSGFDAFLLNPMPAADPPPLHEQAALNGMNGVESVAVISPVLPVEAPRPVHPFALPIASSLTPPSVPSVPSIELPAATIPNAPTPGVDAAAVPALQGEIPEVPEEGSSMIVDRSPTPIIERSPTPPHADFHVDDLLVEGLRDDLRNSTSSLTVEQLEQLRATCLGRIWRQRTEWDRNPLVEELRRAVRDFVDEIREDELDED